MAKRFDLLPVDSTVETDMLDVDGSQILETSSGECTDIDQNGVAKTRKRFTHRALVDGIMFSSSMLWQNAISLVVCNCCRRPPVRWWGRERPCHGLLSAANSTRCSRCGQICCPRHRYQLNDGSACCVRCGRFRRLKSLLSILFFEDVQ